jgi:hypothetical protein
MFGIVPTPSVMSVRVPENYLFQALSGPQAFSFRVSYSDFPRYEFDMQDGGFTPGMNLRCMAFITALGAGDRRNSTPIPPLIAGYLFCLLYQWINKMIKLTKKAIELLDAVTSVPFSRKGLGYTINYSLCSGCRLNTFHLLLLLNVLHVPVLVLLLL